MDPRGRVREGSIPPPPSFDETEEAPNTLRGGQIPVSPEARRRARSSYLPPPMDRDAAPASIRGVLLAQRAASGLRAPTPITEAEAPPPSRGSYPPPSVRGYAYGSQRARAIDPQARPDPYTPINQIVGYVRLLTEALAGRVDPQHLADLRSIDAAARKLISVAREMERDGEEEAPPSSRMSLPPLLDRDAAPLEPDAAAGRRAAVLVVDDSRMNRDVLSRMLRSRDYHVVAAEDGPRALSALSRERFDAVLLDVNMPGMSGLSVLGTIRATRSAAELPVIMVTTQSAVEDVIESLRLGANDHVPKPIDFEVLEARLETQLGLKRAREDLSAAAADLAARNELIRRTFGRYLSDDVVHRLLSEPDAQRLGGEEREVTILMADVRGFSTLTERMSPEKVMALLNGYLGEMARVIVAYGGTIIEFIGDAILAVFGAPFAASDDARRAAACAIQMQIAMDAVNERHAAEGLPAIEAGVALHTGAVVVGNIGSEARTKYGVVGAQVSLAARIEACTVGGQILVSDQTRRAVGPEMLVGASHLLALKGFQDRIQAHELVGLDGPEPLALPRRRAPLRPVAPPLFVGCAVVDGKRVGGEAARGLILALSATGARLRLVSRPPQFENLQIFLPGSLAGRAGGELFAKVVAIDARAPDVVEVRFTSSPPGLAALAEELTAG